MSTARRWTLSLAVLVVVGGLLAAATAATSGASDASANRARAETEAARLLTLINLPPGTTSSATEPHGDGGALAQPGYVELTPNLVDRSAWWTSSAAPNVVLAYVRAHPPDGATWWSATGGSGPGVQTVTFAFGPVHGVLSERLIAVGVVSLADGTTGVRTDGEAVWLTPRPGWEQIPATAHSVTFIGRGATASGRPGRTSMPRHLRGAAAQRLIAFVNALGVVQPGTRACPAGRFGWVRLTFRASDGGTVARAVEQPSGCPSVSLTIGGRRGPDLGDDPTVTSELIRIGAIPVCAPQQLRVAASRPTVDPSGTSSSFGFTNRSASVCRLAGFPAVQLLDARGRRLPVTVHRTGGADAVPLDPDQTAATSLTWRRCGARRATRIRLTVPGVRAVFTLAVGSRRTPVAPCRGRVGIGPLMPT